MVFVVRGGVGNDPVNGWAARRSGLLVGVVLLGVLVFWFGRASARSGVEGEVEEACVHAGLARPAGLSVHFWLQVFPAHRGVTGPWAFTDFALRPMPEECSGAYRRFLYAKIRYKTALKPWRTLLTYNNNEKLTRWIPVWPVNDGTGGKLGHESAGRSSDKPQGQVQHVTARARLWVKDLATGRIVARRLLPVPTTFDRAPHV
jgi:hypothetical protein